MDAKKWWAGLGAALVPVAAVFAMWPSFEPALDWFVRTSTTILERPTVQALLTSMTTGVLMALFLPHVLPDKLSAGVTKALTRFLCGSVAFAACYVLLAPHTRQEQSYALVYATLAWLASAQVWTTASGLLYRVAEKPESLKP